jgi:hypothetical protein
MMKAIPLFGANPIRNWVKASNPPAEAPNATTGKLFSEGRALLPPVSGAVSAVLFFS